MRIGEIIGTVTLSQAHPSLGKATFRLATPLTLADLTGGQLPAAETLVVYDELGAGVGSRVAISEGGEAAQHFLPLDRPVDAYNAAILDRIQLAPTTSEPRHDN